MIMNFRAAFLPSAAGAHERSGDAALGAIAGAVVAGPVGEWANDWLQSRSGLKPATVQSYGSLLRTCVLPRWGAIRLSQVSHGDVEAWVAHLNEQGVENSGLRIAAIGYIVFFHDPDGIKLHVYSFSTPRPDEIEA